MAFTASVTTTESGINEVPSLKFLNQPLTEVTMRIRFQQGLTYSLALAGRIAETVSGELPEVVKYSGGVSDGFSFTIETGPGSGLLLQGPRMSLYAGAAEIFVSWTKAQVEDYPGNQALLSVLAQSWMEIADSIPEISTAVKVVNMSYTTQVFGSPWQTYLNLPSSDIVPESSILGLNLVFRASDTLEYRLDAQGGVVAADNLAGSQIATTAGRLLLDGEDPIQAIQEVHDEMQPVFLSFLTEKALTEWEYQGHGS